MPRVGETGAGEMEIGEMGVGETGPNRIIHGLQELMWTDIRVEYFTFFVIGSVDIHFTLSYSMYMQIQVYDTLIPDTIRLLHVLFVVQSSTSAEPVLSNLVS